MTKVSESLGDITTSIPGCRTISITPLAEGAILNPQYIYAEIFCRIRQLKRRLAQNDRLKDAVIDFDISSGME